MTILAYCPTCKTYVSRKKRQCGTCGFSVSKSKKFRINLATPYGKRITRVVEGNLTFARKVEAKLKTELLDRKHLGVVKAPSLSKVWAKYSKWAKSNKKSYPSDESRWKTHIKPHFNDAKIDQIKRGDIENLISNLRESGGRKDRGCSEATIKHVLVLLKRVINWAIENELYFGPNPCANIKLPNLNNKVTECLEPDELTSLYKTLREWPNRRAAIVVEFALLTGFRLGEILGLRWCDINFEQNFIELGDPKGKPVKMPISKESIEILEYARSIKKGDFVFSNRWGNQRSHFSNIWYRIRARAGIRPHIRFHDLRHTFASYLASSGKVDLFRLQSLLNHQSPDMTQRYAHLLDSALKRSTEIAGEIFGNYKQSVDPTN